MRMHIIIIIIIIIIIEVLCAIVLGKYFVRVVF
jgi:hypothetical protein